MISLVQDNSSTAPAGFFHRVSKLVAKNSTIVSP